MISIDLNIYDKIQKSAFILERIIHLPTSIRNVQKLTDALYKVTIVYHLLVKKKFIKSQNI